MIGVLFTYEGSPHSQFMIFRNGQKLTEYLTNEYKRKGKNYTIDDTFKAPGINMKIEVRK